MKQNVFSNLQKLDMCVFGDGNIENISTVSPSAPSVESNVRCSKIKDGM